MRSNMLMRFLPHNYRKHIIGGIAAFAAIIALVLYFVIPGGTQTGRSPYAWPFSWDSIWNMPIASGASYAAADIKSTATYESPGAVDYDSVSPSFPVVTLKNARLPSGDTGPVSVHG